MRGAQVNFSCYELASYSIHYLDHFGDSQGPDVKCAINSALRDNVAEAVGAELLKAYIGCLINEYCYSTCKALRMGLPSCLEGGHKYLLL